MKKLLISALGIIYCLFSDAQGDRYDLLSMSVREAQAISLQEENSNTRIRDDKSCLPYSLEPDHRFIPDSIKDVFGYRWSSRRPDWLYYKEVRRLQYVCSPLTKNFNDMGMYWPLKHGHLGEGITIAMIDGGIDFREYSIRGSQWINEDETYGDQIDNDGNGYVDDRYGYDFYYDTADTAYLYSQDNSAHGLLLAEIMTGYSPDGEPIEYYHVPGAINPETKGIGPGLKLMNLKAWGTGEDQFESNLSGAIIRYAVDNGADIILMAFANNLVFYNEDCELVYNLNTFPEWMESIPYAWENGVLIVAGSGNVIQENLNHYGAKSLIHKAHYDRRTSHESIIQVNAVQPGALYAEYSTLPGTSVDITAVHELIWRSTCCLSGTSVASALAAATIGVFWAAHPEMTHYQIKKYVLERVQDEVFTTELEKPFFSHTLETLVDLDTANPMLYPQYEMWFRQVREGGYDYRPVANDVPGFDEFYGFGFLSFKDLYLDLKKRDVLIDPVTGAVNGYVRPQTILQQDQRNCGRDIMGIDNLKDPHVYPNPVVGGMLYVTNCIDCELILYTMDGKEVFKGVKTRETPFDLTCLPRGIYLGIIVNNHRLKLWHGKLVL